MADRKSNDRKSRQNDDFDFVNPTEQRKHRRVGSSAFNGIPVVLKPAPPFFGAPVDGKMVDLSGGGTAVLMNEAVMVNTKMKVWIAFPHREAVESRVSVRRVSPVEGPEGTRYLTGLQFLDMPEETATEMAQISADYEACDKRISLEEPPYCVAGCAFYPLCDKPQKDRKAA